MISASLGDISTLELPEDPFEVLEVVWTSLSSWFDLLKKEVIKIETSEDEALQDIDRKLSTSPFSVSTDQLAAAIVLSAPPKRRQIFLQNSVSFENSSDRVLLEGNSKALKRKSWHVERFARFVALEESSEFSSLPSFHRSQSSDPSTGMSLCGTGMSLCGAGMSLFGTGMSFCGTDMSLCGTGMSLCGTGMSLAFIPEALEDAKEVQLTSDPSDSWKPDIVGAYADRLSAITHAFSLCSSAILKSIGKLVIFIN